MGRVYCITVEILLYYSAIEGGASDGVITEDDVIALDLLIAGSADRNSVCPVLSLATMQSESSKSGYAKVCF